jgi:hypothetical protein
MFVFNLISTAAGKPVGSIMFWRSLDGTVAILAFGYAGEVGAINVWIGVGHWHVSANSHFLRGRRRRGWQHVSDCSDAVRTSFNNMRIIVSVGWAIYHLGYFLGTLTSAADPKLLNVIFDVNDFVNKIGFVLSCWTCAKADSVNKWA